MNPIFPFTTNIKLNFSNPPSLRYIPRAITYMALLMIQLPFYWIELVLSSKKIKQHTPVNAPIFVLGHWRSGTTTIQRFLCAHKHVEFLDQYLAFLPLGTSIHQYVFKPVLSGIFKIFNIKHPSHHISLTVDFPSEDDIAFCMGGFQETPMWGHIYSKSALSYFKKFLILKSNSIERCQFLRKYDYFIKRLSYLKNGNQLILKSPANTCRIPELLELYPQAKFIYISRKPIEVYFSTMKLLTNNKDQWLQPMCQKGMNDLFKFGYQQTIERYENTKHLIPKNNLLELELEDLKRAPERIQQEIYNHLKWNIATEDSIKTGKFLKVNHVTKYLNSVPEEIQCLFNKMYETNRNNSSSKQLKNVRNSRNMVS